MARISLDPPRTLANRLTRFLVRRRFGADLDPVLAAGHHRRVLWATALFEGRVDRWNTVDEELKLLAVMASAAALDCGWCMDFGYWKARQEGTDPA